MKRIPFNQLPVVRISRREFAQLLQSKKGATHLRIIARTVPKYRKTGCPYSLIEKISDVRVTTGAQYAKAVNKQLKENGLREGFKAGALPYGKITDDNKIVTTDAGSIQLRTQYRNPRKPLSVTYLADGQPVEREEIAAFLTEGSYSNKQANKGLIRAEKQVGVRNFGFDNIQEAIWKQTRFIFQD